MSRKGFSVVSSVLALFLTTPGQGRTEWIDTLPAWPGNTYTTELGTPPFLTTFGQTFTAPASANALTSFSFNLQHDFGGPVNFAAYVMQWDGTGASDPVLYQSEKQTLLPSDTGFRPFTFTMNTPVVAGKQYVAFLSTLSFLDGKFGGMDLGIVMTNPYAGGQFVAITNGSTNILGVKSTWNTAASMDDAAFTASFTSGPPSTAPEPGSVTLLCLGALGIAGHSWRKRRLARATWTGRRTGSLA
jgi:hypothetical protein